MAKPAKQSDLVCLNHPDRRATARCAQCSKPICPECAVERNGDTYCGEACSAARAEYESREARRALAGKRTEHFGLREWGWRVVILLLISGILYYVFGVQEVRSAGDFGEMLRRMF